MKKNLLLLVLLMSINTLLFAQAKEADKLQDTKSKTLEFMAKDGSFIKKEFFDMGKVKGVKCDILIITNIVNQQKMGCLRLETSYSSSYSSSPDTYIGTLDYDEIDACVKSLHYIKDNFLPSTPNVYTEAEFKTRDNVKFGAFYNESKKKWSAFVYTKGYTSRSAEFFDSSNIDSLIEIMNQAKGMIQEKTK